MLVTDLNSFFYDQLSTFFRKENTSVREETKQYLTSVLTTFSAASELRHKYLFQIYGDCVEDQSFSNYKYLGDHSLYISGCFPHSLNRSLVGLNYYIGMGQLGYQQSSLRAPNRGISQLYDDMAANFKTYMNGLYSISALSLEKNKLSLYNQFLETNSPSALEELLKLGIMPINQPRKEQQD